MICYGTNLIGIKEILFIFSSGHAEINIIGAIDLNRTMILLGGSY